MNRKESSGSERERGESQERITADKGKRKKSWSRQGREGRGREGNSSHGSGKGVATERVSRRAPRALKKVTDLTAILDSHPGPLDSLNLLLNLSLSREHKLWSSFL